VREGVDFGYLGLVSVDAAETGEGVLAVDVHGAGTAYAFSAGAAESERGVDFVLDFDERVEDHWACLVEIDGVGL